MTYEVSFVTYKAAVDRYCTSFKKPIMVCPVDDTGQLLRIADGDVLVRMHNGVDKLVFKDQEHFMEWVLKWA